MNKAQYICIMVYGKWIDSLDAFAILLNIKSLLSGQPVHRGQPKNRLF